LILFTGTTNHLGLQPGLALDQIGEPTNYSRRAEDYFILKQKYLPSL
jgi:hypothetical protein